MQTMFDRVAIEQAWRLRIKYLKPAHAGRCINRNRGEDAPGRTAEARDGD